MNTILTTALPPIPDEVRTQLNPGETLLWRGTPRQGLLLRTADWFQVPFSLMWGGFAIFWEWSVLHSGGAPGFMALWGIPFVLAGLYLIIGRFFFDAHLRARTHYAVTNERVLIIGGAFGRKVKSLSLRLLPEITLTEHGATGTIVFGAPRPGQSWFAGNQGMGWPGIEAAPGFEQIAQPRAVYELLRRAQRQDR